jgi:hypothetical protein
MESRYEASHGRRVLIGTTHGMIEGELALSPQVRTLDFFNRGTTRFVTLNAARSLSSGPSLQSDVVNLNLTAILWVAEVESGRPRGRAGGNPQLNRSAVRFCFHDCEILGFLHTPVQGDPFARLNQDRSPFVAVTSASIIGGATEMAAPFLAVNGQRAFTVELIPDAEAVESGMSELEEAET